MKIFLTGASGFIGRAFCRVAAERGHRLIALCRNERTVLPEEIEIAKGDLASVPWSQVERFAPEAALHLAWVATPGVYLDSPENEIWLEQSKAFFGRLRDMQVAHVAATGTCIEYAASTDPLNETSSRLDPAFPYSRAKVALFEWLRDAGTAASTGWAWFRLFYPYGPGEHPHRMSTSLIHQLRARKSVALRTPHSVKDYIFIDDTALAICLALEARLTGAINVGAGQGISIRRLAERIAELLQADPSLVQEADQPSPDPTPVVIADNRRLRGAGWRPGTNLDAGLERLIHSLPASPES
jgi:dTDP-6-deoxy-L-talose 4-dehydrogenase (NAD+)